MLGGVLHSELLTAWDAFCPARIFMNQTELALSSSCPSQRATPGQQGLLESSSLGEEKPEPPAGSPEEERRSTK